MQRKYPAKFNVSNMRLRSPRPPYLPILVALFSLFVFAFSKQPGRAANSSDSSGHNDFSYVLGDSDEDDEDKEKSDDENDDDNDEENKKEDEHKDESQNSNTEDENKASEEPEKTHDAGDEDKHKEQKDTDSVSDSENEDENHDKYETDTQNSDNEEEKSEADEARENVNDMDYEDKDEENEFENIEEADDNELEEINEEEKKLIMPEGVSGLESTPVLRTKDGESIYVKTKKGNVKLSVSPTAIVEKVKSASDQKISKVEKVEVEVDDKTNKVEFSLKVKKERKLLGIFKVEVPSTIYYDAQTGDYLEEKTSLVGALLKLFSF